jgi:WD40 repeat protein
MAAGAGLTMRLWDLTAPDPAQAVKTWRTGIRSILALEFSPDGRWLVAGVGQQMRLWDGNQLEPAAEPLFLRGHESWITKAAFSRDSRYLASGDADGAIRLWDLASDTHRPAEEVASSELRGAQSMSGLAFSPDGRRLLSAGDDGVRSWRLDWRELVTEAQRVTGRSLSLEERERHQVGFPHLPASEFGEEFVATVGPEDGLKIMLYSVGAQTWKDVSREPIFGSHPAWSSDGRRIAFIADRNGVKQAFVMDVAGGTPVQVTRENFSCLSATWRFDGSQLAVARYFDKGQGGLSIVQPAGVEADRIVQQQVLDPAWSPDGKHLAFASRRSGQGFRLYVMDADGENVRELTTSANHTGYVYPAWSPDGRRIAFADYVRDGLEICVIDADGQNLQVLTDLDGDNICPMWSRDGKKVLFQHCVEGGVVSLAVINTDGRQFQEFAVPRAPGRLEREPFAWRPHQDSGSAP